MTCVPVGFAPPKIPVPKLLPVLLPPPKMLGVEVPEPEVEPVPLSPPNSVCELPVLDPPNGFDTAGVLLPLPKSPPGASFEVAAGC